jgi:putative ABC transport system substrate-binding protein
MSITGTKQTSRRNAATSVFDPMRTSAPQSCYAAVTSGVLLIRTGTGRVRRRDFIKAIVGSAVAWPRSALGQPRERIRRIGVILGLSDRDPQGQLNVQALLKGLRERGLNEGQNLKIDFHFGAATPDTLQKAVTEALATAPDLIIAQGTAVTAALHQHTRTVPIVFTVVSDPIGSGFVQSFAHPGGNITGFTNFLEPSLAAKWVELLKEVAPRVSRVGILFNPNLAAGGGMYFVKPVETSAAALGVKAVELAVQTPADIEQALDAFAREPGGGLITPPDATTLPQRDLILMLAARHRLPAVHPYRFFVTAGGLMSYGMDYADVFLRAASYVDRILKGEKPADLPVQTPTKFELVINVKTANVLGLDVPGTLLARSDEVIQ